jgi:hypothetical protein
MKKFKVLLVLLFVGVLSSSFVSPSTNMEYSSNLGNELINFYVVNNTNKSIIIGVHKPNNCNSTSLSCGVDSGRKKRYTARKGSCIKVYRGNTLGTADYEGQTFTVN